MGYDPDEAPDGLLDGLLEYMSSYGAGAIREIAAEHKDKTISHVNDIWEDAQKNDMVVDVPNCDSIRQRLASESSDSDIPWKHATHAAKIVRESWGLTAPISTDSLCNLLSIQTSRFMTGQNNDRRQLTAGVRSTCVPNKFHISLNSKYVTSRRFGLARLVADHIVTGQEEVLLPVTRSITSRQRFQRAFAQEFLCPFDDLKEYFSAEVPSSDDVYDAARYFDVSPLTIQTTLVNKGVFGQEALEDWVG